MNRFRKLLSLKRGLGNLRFIGGWTEAQVTTWTCSWHLKWRAVLLERALKLWDLTLFPGIWCYHGIELQDTQLVSYRELLAGENLHTFGSQSRMGLKRVFFFSFQETTAF